jgi:hypothetical protein
MKTRSLIIGSVVLLAAPALVACSRERSPGTAAPNAGPPPAPSTNVQTLDPKTILFSLPTLCDGLPPVGPPVETVPAGAVTLNEDDWRQIELVAARDREAVGRELAELSAFKVANRVGAGWKNVYVRSSRPDAIRASAVPLARVQALAGPRAHRSRLFLGPTGGTASEVQGGFAIDLGKGVTLYGHAADGKVISLNLQLTGDAAGGPIPPAVSAIARAFNLFVVDWYRGQILEHAG